MKTTVNLTIQFFESRYQKKNYGKSLKIFAPPPPPPPPPLTTE